jgi:HK97 family phage major capsid protein
VLAIATTVKSICIGNWDYYSLVERSGMTVSRNPYLYEANDQVGFFARIRWGGMVSIAEAFQYGTQA